MAGPDEKDLSAAELEVLTRAVERIQRKRKVMLIGYVLALLVMLLGTLTALYVYGSTPKGTNVAWVFFIPMAGVGLILWLFGRWSRKV